MAKFEKEDVDMDSIYREYANLVYRFLCSCTHDADWSQELIQETFFRAITSIPRYDGSCKMSVWLCQIVKHILWQEIRKRKRIDTAELGETFSDVAAPEGKTSILRQESRLELYQAIHQLPELEREVVPYRITGELSFREIGGILGGSENWARTAFYRAKLKIGKELKQHEQRFLWYRQRFAAGLC